MGVNTNAVDDSYTAKRDAITGSRNHFAISYRKDGMSQRFKSSARLPARQNVLVLNLALFRSEVTEATLCENKH